MTAPTANAIIAMASMLWWSVAFVSIPVSSGYDKITLKEFDVDDYKKFIDEFRKKMPTSGDKDGIKLLQKSPDKNHEFMLVEFQSEAKIITFSVDSKDLYVLGYQVNKECWLFDDIPKGAADKIYPKKDVKHNNLGFKHSYTAIERQSGPRSEIPLGLLKLKDSALLVAKYPSGKDGKTDKTKQRAEALVVIIQLISEVVRFLFIENWVTEKPFENRKPDKQVIDYELNWEKLGKEIRDAKKGEVPEDKKKAIYVIKP